MEKVAYVFSLIDPQFSGGPVALKLNSQILLYGPHVDDAKLHVQMMLCLVQERVIITTSHAIIDMPGQQTEDTIPAKKEYHMVNFTLNKPLASNSSRNIL